MARDMLEILLSGQPATQGDVERMADCFRGVCQSRIAALEEGLSNLLNASWCNHSCVDCEGMGACPNRKDCKCAHCKALELVNLGGK